MNYPTEWTERLWSLYSAIGENQMTSPHKMIKGAPEQTRPNLYKSQKDNKKALVKN